MQFPHVVPSVGAVWVKSGPASFSGFKFCKSFRIPATEILKSAITVVYLRTPGGYAPELYLPQSAISWSFILQVRVSDNGSLVVKTDWKCRLCTSAFSAGAVIIALSSSEKETTFCYHIQSCRHWDQGELLGVLHRTVFVAFGWFSKCQKLISKSWSLVFLNCVFKWFRFRIWRLISWVIQGNDFLPETDLPGCTEMWTGPVLRWNRSKVPR